MPGGRVWSLAAAALLGIAAILVVAYFAVRPAGVLLVVAAGFAALSVLIYLAGRLASPAPVPALLYSDRPSDPPFQSSAAMELEQLRDRLADTEGRPLRRIPSTDLTGIAREVAEQLNARLDALSGTGKEQQQFIADVSHELRTPLTVLRGTLEVALEEDRPAEEYREAIGNALLETRHLALRILDRKKYSEALRRPASDRDAILEVSRHELAFLNRHCGDVASLDLLIVLRIGDLRSGFLGARHVCEKRSGEEDKQHPERELLRGLAPFTRSFRFLRNWYWHYCKLAMYGKWRKFSA